MDRVLVSRGAPSGVRALGEVKRGKCPSSEGAQLCLRDVSGPGALSTTRTFPVCVLLVIPGPHYVTNVAVQARAVKKLGGDPLGITRVRVWICVDDVWTLWERHAEAPNKWPVTSTFGASRWGQKFYCSFSIRVSFTPLCRMDTCLSVFFHKAA